MWRREKILVEIIREVFIEMKVFDMGSGWGRING